jgi:SAM-dependent methyltransferase
MPITRSKPAKKRVTCKPLDPNLHVDIYLRGVGISDERPWDRFWSRLAHTHGSAAEDVREAIKAGDLVHIYDMVNRTRALSLDMASPFLRNLYREYLRWFVAQKFPSPASVLDIGCANGVLTCFYAHVFPDARVYGIDCSDNAIHCARELASQLSLTNVEFGKLSVENVAEVFTTTRFDLITAGTIFKDVLTFPDRSVDEGRPSSTLPSWMFNLVSCLSASGLFLSWERCSNFDSFLWWAELLNQAGLTLALQRSHLLSFVTDGETETLPVLVGERSERRKVVMRDDLLAFYDLPTSLSGIPRDRPLKPTATRRLRDGVKACATRRPAKL